MSLQVSRASNVDHFTEEDNLFFEKGRYSNDFLC